MEAITQSMLGMFLRCPHQFERRYLRGEIIPPGIAARRGSATPKAPKAETPLPSTSVDPKFHRRFLNEASV